jgi:HAD superfamily hydrolase (TIGR01509 family)
MLKAVLFDCDGVLVDTERDGHRVAFNQAFQQKGYNTEWDTELYGELLKIAGGKERMKHYFSQHGYPDGITDTDAFIKEMHLAKTEAFMNIIDTGQLPLRPGIARIVDEIINAGLRIAVCSTSNVKAVTLVVERMLGEERRKHFNIYAGDMVEKKKPAPDIYNMAKEDMNLLPEECVVIEDSRNGLLAAKAAGMKCVVTKSSYTEDEDFSEADKIVSELGDEPKVQITVDDLKNITG